MYLFQIILGVCIHLKIFGLYSSWNILGVCICLEIFTQGNTVICVFNIAADPVLHVRHSCPPQDSHSNIADDRDSCHPHNAHLTLRLLTVFLPSSLFLSDTDAADCAFVDKAMNLTCVCINCFDTSRVRL